MVVVAAFLCLAGSGLTVMTLRRLVVATGRRKLIQLALSGLVTGATIWATHFIAMLAFDPGVEHGYGIAFTVISLLVAVLGSLLANACVSYGNGPAPFVFAGVLFGLTVSLMHYTGMSAFQIPGEIIWLPRPRVVSVLLGVGLGVASYHRIMFPITRWCWQGGTVFMVLSICAMHFIGMSAFEIRLDSSVSVAPQILSDTMMGLLIFSVVTIILFIGFSSIGIETHLEREAMLQLEHTVMHDHLTGLPNRLHFKRRMQQAKERLAHDPSAGVGVVSVDLDLFKQVNDIHGHETGDQVLKVIAQRIRAVITPQEFVARIGGDEFVAIKCDLQTTEESSAFAQRLYDAIVPVIRLENCVVSTGACLGVASSLHDDRDPDVLLQKSDLALYRAKRSPDRHICVYDTEMDQLVRQKMALIGDLRQALAEDQFSLVYQLQNDATSRAIVGCEVLLRWNHPTLGAVSPAEFIPLAEETGLINDIGRWVLRTACAEAASWNNAWSIAVNVAPQQLSQPSFADEVAFVLEETNLPAARLELEVTEASVIQDQASTLRVLKQIKQMGVRIAMDDFGTGYSSLATLQAFPFDKIKIDRSFVTDLDRNPQRAAIVRSTLALGEAFGIPVLAEGVETEAELRFLSAESCRYVQGFLFGKPMPVDAMRARVAERDVTIAS